MAQLEEVLSEVLTNNRNALIFIRSWDSSSPSDVQKAKLDELISSNQVLLKKAGISPANESLAEAVINTNTGEIPAGTPAAEADASTKADVEKNGLKDNTSNEDAGKEDEAKGEDAKIATTKAPASKSAAKKAPAASSKAAAKKGAVKAK